jgi:hypothetical protein
VKKKPRRRNAEGGAGSAQKARTPIESAVRELFVVIHFAARTSAGTWTTALPFRQDKQVFGMGRELVFIVAAGVNYLQLFSRRSCKEYVDDRFRLVVDVRVGRETTVFLPEING